MIQYTTEILKFKEQGEKTGWSYIEIPANIAKKLKPACKVSFRVKGKLDNFPIKQVSLLPMGEGDFIMPINATIRKGIKKTKGATLNVQLEEDTSEFAFNADFITCLEDEPEAMKFFKSQPGSHQKYFSKWIDSAKTDATKAKRIAMAVNALARHLNYAQMLREQSAKKYGPL
ncbi:MAG TPA: YdeI/OmpD-associated family protein [Bacteroidia bacterium]|jgi:hypothetical protein|nr:YdeI/OmpD-associated family protein [Bacteroidia bacterium]